MTPTATAHDDTDAYKLPMSEAGFPLRTETFYYSHRRGGPHLLPFDAPALVKALLPKGDIVPDTERFLNEHGYRLGAATTAAFKQTDKIVVDALPKGSWFFDREPAFSVTGPSTPASWLEPLALQLHYRIQVASLALTEPLTLKKVVARVTCNEQRDLIIETLDAIGVKHEFPIDVAIDEYAAAVRSRVAALIEIVEDPRRIFEVGMRAASCREQHEIALVAAKEAGLLATSNVGAARRLDLRPVGTMGHEHVQRFGSDTTAFRAMRDRFPGPTSFLLDTFSTLDSGIPAAFDLIAEDVHRNDFIRFDSGDKKSQFIYAVMKARGMHITPRFILEDSFDLALTREFEVLRKMLGVPPEDVIYGYGGHIVCASGDPLTRDRVSAVYKLSQTGHTATMKFGDESGAGKESIPGRPVVYRPMLGSSDYRGVLSVIAQMGEERRSFDTDNSLSQLTGATEIPHYLRFSVGEAQAFAQRRPALQHSPETTRLVAELRAARRTHGA